MIKPDLYDPKLNRAYAEMAPRADIGWPWRHLINQQHGATSVDIALLTKPAVQPFTPL